MSTERQHFIDTTGDSKSISERHNVTAPIDRIVDGLWNLEQGDTTLKSLSVEEFTLLAARWQIPTSEHIVESLDKRKHDCGEQKNIGQEKNEHHHDDSSHDHDSGSPYSRLVPFKRYVLAQWSVQGPTAFFIFVFVSLQIILFIYYFVLLERDPRRPYLGWGLPFAKGAAGVLYPTLAFLLLSSCRRLGTFLRYWGWPARFINWDRSQHFHIILGCTLLFFALMHAASHLIGTFRSAVGQTTPLLYRFPHPITYSAMISTRAGSTGICALFILICITATSHPYIRHKYFQVFQVTHYLIYAFIALLLAHGSQGLIEPPVLGWWLIAPILAVLWDRIFRFIQHCRPVKNVSFSLIEDHTIILSIPKTSVTWSYKAGQYLLVRIAEVSWYEWHPYSVVASNDGQSILLYIQQAGDWSRRVIKHYQANMKITVTIDGPFGPLLCIACTHSCTL